MATKGEHNDDAIPGQKHASLKNEVLETMSMGLCMSIGQIFLASMGIIVISFAGKMGTHELNGVGLALSFGNLTCWTLASGLSAASETLFAQAYGSTSKEKVGVFLQRSIIFFTLAWTIAMIINFNSGVIFVLLGQDEVLSSIAQRFLMVLTPGYICFFMSKLLLSYIRVLGASLPIILSPAMGGLTVLIFGYKFVILDKMGIDGLALALTLAYSSIFLCLVAYIFITKIYQDTWSGWSKQAFYDWCQYSKLGLAGVVFLTCEFGFIETITLLSGTMGPFSLAVGAITTRTMHILFSIPYGFSVTGIVRVGISLGAKDARAAKRAVWFTLGLGSITCGIIDLIIVILRYPVMYIFTNDEHVIKLGVDVIFIVCADNLGQLVFKVLQGIQRGCGRHFLASLIDLVCIYFIGVPCMLGFVLGLHAGVQECWLIYAGITALMATCLAIVLYRTDWEEQIEQAQKRVKGKDMDQTVQSAKSDANDECTALFPPK